MNLIIYTILFVFLILLAVQFIILYVENRIRRGKDTKLIDGLYPNIIIEAGNTVMSSVTTGIVKKQILPNHALPYDSTQTLEKYTRFVGKSSFYQMGMSIEERRFDG